MTPKALVILGVGFAACLLHAEEIPGGLSREEALKMARTFDGREIGSLWFDHGDQSGPYRHAGRVILRQGDQAAYEVAQPGQNLMPTGIDVPGGAWETRLDFFTSAAGHGWATAHTFKPEITPTRSRERKDTRSETQKALGPAAMFAIQQGNLELLKVLLAAGLEIDEALDFENRSTALYAAVGKRNLEITRFLLEQGASPEKRSRYGERPIDLAINREMGDFLHLLEKPGGKEPQIAGIPEGVLDRIFANYETEEIHFIEWRKKDPPAELLTWLQQRLPQARPASHMEILERRPLGAHSWYRDKNDGGFGSLLQVSVEAAKDGWKVRLRDSVGPSMAGGGWEATIAKSQGHWRLEITSSWDE